MIFNAQDQKWKMKIQIAEKKELYPYNTERRCLVLVSTYNGELYIKEQLESLIGQKYVHLDILIRDDGSTDSTIAVIESIINENNLNERIKIFKGANIGIHYSFAELIDLAPSEYDYYLFSDQDDIWDLEKVFVATELLNMYQVPFYWGCARLVNSKGESLGVSTSNPQLFKYYMNSSHKVMTPGVQGCTMVLTKELFLSIRETNYPRYYGHDTWIPIVANYCYGGVYDTIPRMSYRQHDSSWTGNRDKKLKQIKRETVYFLRGLGRYSMLAEDILIRFRKLIDENDAKYLESLAEKGSFFERIYNIDKYRYSKNSKLKSYIFWAYYILSK